MKKQINYKVSGEEWSKAKDKAFAKVSKNAKVDGFRQGKVPRNVFEKKYGTGDIVRSAMEDLIDAKYGEIIVTEKLIPAVEPKLEIVSADDDGFEVNITIITDPEVKLGKYKELKVKKDKVEVTKEEIEHEVGHILDRFAELVSKDGAVGEGIQFFNEQFGFIGLSGASQTHSSIYVTKDGGKTLKEIELPMDTVTEYPPHMQKNIEPDITVEEGDVISLGSLVFKVMHTPGHTMGSVCYYIESERTLFTGDTLFCLTTGRTDLFGGNDDDMYASIKRLYEMPGEYTVYPGHNRATTMEYERRRNRYMRRFK